VDKVMKTILVIDDELLIRNALKRLLNRHQYQVIVAETVEEAIPLITTESLDLILTDVRLPGASGTSLLQQVTKIPIIIMSSYASINSAVDAMKLGAIDYIAKPFEHAELLTMISRIVEQQTPSLSIPIEKINKEIPIIHDEHSSLMNMVGNCPALLEIKQRINKVSPMDTSILILGETGTGKELVAQAIHQLSYRQDAQLVSINCAAIAENLIESELFGYNKGAFTGAIHDQAGLIETANSGTLFLDEIGELSLEVQARLLRVLQEKEVRRVGSTQTRQVDIRLIAATHKNLAQMVNEQLFRQDLYFRLNVFELCLPPLRERGNDIMLLANHVLTQRVNKMKHEKVHFSAEVVIQFQRYAWPGNIRELQNIIERALILTDSNEINLTHIAFFNEQKVAKKVSSSMVKTLSLDQYLIHFLHQNNHQTETELARQLGISRKTLWEKRHRLKIPKKVKS
jgi:DNA-binding NtrC family response regulator